jgi:hypothetical protein
MNKKFSNKIVCVDLKNSTPYKEKKKLIDLLVSNGAKVSFFIKKGVSILIKNDIRDVNSFKCKSAFKLEIPVVHSEYIFRYLNNEIVNYKDYLIVNNENCEYFKRGKILKSKFNNIYK